MHMSGYDDRFEIKNLNTAWSFLDTYCMVRTREGYYQRTSDIATVNEIFELNQTARSDISTIQAHIRNILQKVDKMTEMFKYYFTDGDRPVKLVFLKDILEYLQTHIAVPEIDGPHAQEIKMSSLLAKLHQQIR